MDEFALRKQLLLLEHNARMKNILLEAEVLKLQQRYWKMKLDEGS